MSAEDYFPAAQRELWKLIERRRGSETTREAVDRHIWEAFGDEGAILYSDLAGFAQWTAELGITHFLQTILQSHLLLRPLVARHGGTVVEVVGDSMLIWFRPIDDCIRCAVAMQQACRQHNADLAPCDQVLLCLGIGYGRVLRVGSSRLAGSELNVASKLGEDLATRDEILISESARRAAGSLPEITFQPTDLQAHGTSQVYRIHYATHK